MKRLAVALDHVGPRRGVFVDVGANIGTTCLPALHVHEFRRAIAIEPEQSNARLLAANAALNGLSERITIHQVAASDRTGTLRLSIHPSNSGGHRVTEGAGQEVAATTLDSLLEAEGVSPADVGLLWIDVQGHELAVLRGAGSLLAARVPFVVEQTLPSELEWGELTRGYVPISLGSGAVDDVLFVDEAHAGARGSGRLRADL